MVGGSIPLPVGDTHMVALPPFALLHKNHAVAPLGGRSWQSFVVVAVAGLSGYLLTPQACVGPTTFQA